MNTLETRDLGLVCGGAAKGDPTEGLCGAGLIIVGTKTAAVAASAGLATEVGTLVPLAITCSAGTGAVAIGAGAVVGCGGYMVGTWIENETGIGSTVGGWVGTQLGNMGFWW